VSTLPPSSFSLCLTELNQSHRTLERPNRLEKNADVLFQNSVKHTWNEDVGQAKDPNEVLPVDKSKANEVGKTTVYSLYGY
jgi:hypothetical protein